MESWLKSLDIETPPVLIVPKQSDRDTVERMWKQNGYSVYWRVDWPNVVEWPKEAPLGTILPGYSEGMLYAMNPSSLLPPLALDPQPNERVLDACSAPGGKAILIASRLSEQGELVANDLSASRLTRLKTIFQQFDIRATTLHADASTLFKSIDHPFDRILLDAPCSSEKHVWNSPKHLSVWSPNRVKQLAQRQFALLSGLLRALKPGGTLVYSTCAVNPIENEGVVERFLHRYSDQITLIKPPQRINATETNDPMFVATFVKASQSPSNPHPASKE